MQSNGDWQKVATLISYLQMKIVSSKASIETLPDSIDKLCYAFPCLNNTQMNYKLMKSIILHLSVTQNILSLYLKHGSQVYHDNHTWFKII